MITSTTWSSGGGGAFRVKNKKCQVFCSRECLVVQAPCQMPFSCLSHQDGGMPSPLFPKILRVLNKQRQDATLMIMTAPAWTREFRYLDLVNFSMQPRITLLDLPVRVSHYNHKSSILTSKTWMLTGWCPPKEAVQLKFRTFCSEAGKSQLDWLIKLHGKGFLFWASQHQPSPLTSPVSVILDYYWLWNNLDFR